jgi:formaldehyde-activating enzyme involved in methanogenesis
MATSYSAAIWAVTEHSVLNNYIDEQLNIAVSNFIRENKQDFKGLFRNQKKQEIMIQNSVNNQDLTSESFEVCI